MLLAIGMRLGPYEIVAPLGSGGMGEVYRARDTRLVRTVAIKLLTGPVGHDARARLLEEARAAAALNHPNICTIHEIADVDDRLFIVMEHVDGRVLSDLVVEGTPVDAAIRYGIQIADALTHAHDRGIVHRDLKTANLMLTADGRVKVLDFGIAQRFTDPAIDSATQLPTLALGLAAGTLAYIAPEVLRGGIADRRADIWAIGVVLYELLAGRRPFGGETTFELSSAILRDALPPLPSRVPKPLRALVARCLEKDPAQRYQRAGEVRAALEMIAAAAGQSAGRTRQPTASAPAPRVVREQPATAAPVTDEKSVIVLPFANLSPDADDAYFSDGLTDELVTDLCRVAGLRVVPSAASFRLKKANKDLATIAREFNVRYIVEGRVRKAGQSIRITAQLVDVAEDRTIWADKYSGEFEHVFELQERVSRSIAEALQLRLQPASRAPKPEAAEAYLKGRHFARQATSAGFQKALECFRQATELDPNYAPALAALAEVYVNLTTGWDALPALETMPKAQAAARRALELDPTLPEAHVVRALVAMFYEWDPQTAEREFREALRLNPNYADAHKWYAALLIWLDPRYDEALGHIQRAITLDPVDPWIQVQTVWVYAFSRDFTRAVEQARQVIAADPLYGYGHYALGCALIGVGQAEEAIPCFKRGIELDGRGAHHVALLGMAYALAGRREEALGCLTELDALDKAGRNVAAFKVYVYAGLRDADQVMQWLEVAVAQRTSSTIFLTANAFLDFVRQDPRFIALLQKMGLGYLATRTWTPEWRPPSTPRVEAPPTPGAAATAVADLSIVVLPFGNLSPSTDDEYFSDGLTDELIADLSKIRALRVICRTSAMRLKGTEKDPHTIGRELDVRYVLAGSVRKAGSSLRITAELIEAATNTALWAEKYSGTLADVFDVQERVSREIVRALDLTLSPPEAQQLTYRPVTDPIAYDCYLRARHEIWRVSSDALDRATRLLNQALAIVGENPLLRAYLSYADVLRFRVGVSSDDDLLARAEVQARDILAGAPDSAIAWMLLGMVAYERGQLQEAVRHLQRTLALEPNNADALTWLVSYHLHAGRTEAAALLAAQVVKLDPLFAMGLGTAAAVHWFDGRFAEAIPGMTRAMELDADNLLLRWMWGYTLALNGRVDEAADQANRLRRTDPDFPYTRQLVSLADALRGRQAEALEQLAPLERIRLDAHLSLHVAESHAVAGDDDRALALLQQAVEQGFHPYAFIAKHGPFFERLRRNVRFERIVAEAQARCERFQP